jgi:signal transduction histidine kinase
MADRGERPRLLGVDTSAAEPGTVTITVTDTGAGAPAAELERMFELFTSSKASGLGMGLWITRSIIEAHGGASGPRATPTVG